MQPPELLATCWTTAGAVAPTSSDKRSPENFAARVEAASKAGFVGFGLGYADLLVARDTFGFNEMRAILSQFKMKYFELEMLRGWYEQGSAREVGDQFSRDIFDAAAKLDVLQIKAGCAYHTLPVPFEVVAREFKELCQRAAHANTRVAFEPQPMSPLRTPQDALRLVELADHPAAGMIIDIWHVTRAGVALDSIRDIPLEKIFAVEINDASSEIVGTLIEDTANNRRFCGEGDFDLPRFIAVLEEIGYNGCWGIEIISQSVRDMPMPEAVQCAFITASACFRDRR